MFLGILVLITALSISAVAIYYSVAGLVAIFAAATIPIMIMGGVLEIGKLVTAVWLHRYWREARWFLKAYLSIAVLVLMFITSMGIFGFLSKAHIEQTASAEEGLAQMDRIDEELIRLGAVIERAEQRIEEAEASIGEGNTAIQEQIDKEQTRIDTAYDRIQPAIDEQQEIITGARSADNNRTAPFESQLQQLDDELRRLANLANEYETRLDNLSPDTTPVNRLLEQVAQIEENIIVTTNRLQSSEPAQVRLGQATIGVTDDGLFGGNTRRALTAWVEAQQTRIAELELQASELRQQAQSEVEVERTRLTNLVEDIRGPQTQAVKERQIELLSTIDEVRATESPVIQRARDEIARIREGADAQIAASNELIQRLRDSLTVGTDPQVEAVIEEKQQKIIEANNSIDTLTEEKYTLQAEYRKLEAEVGPIKYLAEFVYGDTADQDLLEEAVRWVIIVIIFVFDPLAVLLLIASQATFEMRRAKREAAHGESLRQDYERTRAQRIIDNPGFNINPPLAAEEEKVDDDTDRPNDGRNDRQSGNRGGNSDRDPDRDSTEISPTGNDSGRTKEQHQLSGANDLGGNTSGGMDTQGERVNDQPMEKVDSSSDAAIRDMVPEDDVSADDETKSRVEQNEIQSNGLTADEAARAYTGLDPKKKDIESLEELDEDSVLEERKAQWDAKESNVNLADAKTKWKQEHPDETIKMYKLLYLKGKIDELPWENEKYNSKTTETTQDVAYIQNSEQNENTIFNRLRSESKD